MQQSGPKVPLRRLLPQGFRRKSDHLWDVEPAAHLEDQVHLGTWNVSGAAALRPLRLRRQRVTLQDEGRSSMSSRQKVCDFFKTNPTRFYCDDCLEKGSGVDRHEINSIARTLALFPTEFFRQTTQCVNKCSYHDKECTKALKIQTGTLPVDRLVHCRSRIVLALAWIAAEKRGEPGQADLKIVDKSVDTSSALLDGLLFLDRLKCLS